MAIIKINNIDKSNIFAPLSNDYYMSLNINNKIWKSVSHYIYSNMCKNSINKLLIEKYYTNLKPDLPMGDMIQLLTSTLTERQKVEILINRGYDRQEAELLVNNEQPAPQVPQNNTIK